jgi:hypothetical protein
MDKKISIEEYTEYTKNINSKKQKATNTKEKTQSDNEMFKEMMLQFTQSIQMLMEMQMIQNKELLNIKNHLMTGTISTKQSNKY